MVGEWFAGLGWVRENSALLQQLASAKITPMIRMRAALGLAVLDGSVDETAAGVIGGVINGTTD